MGRARASHPAYGALSRYLKAAAEAMDVEDVSTIRHLPAR